MDMFEKKRNEENKIFKNTQYDWLIDYIPEPIRKSVGGFKNKIGSFTKTNTPKQTIYGRGKKLSKPKKQNKRNPFISEENKKTKDRIIGDIWRLFATIEEKKERNQRKKIAR